MQKSLASQPGLYLTFHLNEQTYAMTIALVREIIRLDEITVVPQTPSYVAGVMNLRGKVIPIVNMRLKLDLGAASATKDTCIIVAETQAGQVGMIVDSVSAVVEFTANQIEPAPDIGHSGQVLGIGKQDKLVVIMLDIDACLNYGNLGLQQQAS